MMVARQRKSQYLSADTKLNQTEDWSAMYNTANKHIIANDIHDGNGMEMNG